MVRAVVTGVLFLVCCEVSRAQVVLRDSTESVELPQVVVTATRSERALERVPVPTTLVTSEVIATRGANRMSEVLAEEVGLMLVEDHGTGLQLQGFDPAYTLILVDGEPVLGRVAGTLDLDRLSVTDVERVEVVRGPSSALYGSEALAGVVNVITRRPRGPAAISLRSRFETHGTSSLSANAEVRGDDVGIRFTADRYSSDGYDLTPGVLGATAPAFTDYTASGLVEASLGGSSDLTIRGRLATQQQQNQALVTDAGEASEARTDASRTDWSVAPEITHRVRPGFVVAGRLYASRYQTSDEMLLAASGDVFNASTFRQGYLKGEVQTDLLVASRHLLTAGAGYVRESVEADRIRGGTRRTSGGFALLQHEFSPFGWMDVNTSGRLDLHSAYGAHVSPKLALLARPSDRTRIRASVGSGFKSPTFQQLYLDFTNPTAGYSVVGSVDAEDALRAMEAQGQVSRFLTDLATLQEVGPETSVAVNLGFEAEPVRWLELRLNLFHNEVQNLIETLPVATKPNGQSVFSYFNLNRIYTRGLEAEVGVSPVRSLTVSAGYQLLDAKDRDVLDAIADGLLYKRVDGRDRRVTAAEYGGLMNRSRHALNLQFTFSRPGFTASFRGQYRSRYGHGDYNGNLVLDDAREYVPGYWLWHATLTHELPLNLTAQAGIRNLLGKTEPTLIPSLSGRLLFAGLQLDL